ncbi:MAG: hypothetical protein NT031_05105 [Planctomycetota bacterium]|nr:hypothetical protein [Planctomycetota bacterium]
MFFEENSERLRMNSMTTENEAKMKKTADESVTQAGTAPKPSESAAQIVKFSPSRTTDMEPVEFTCGRCGAKGLSKVKLSGKAHYPRNWKPYNGVLTCEKCRRRLYHTITLSWRIKGCASATNVFRSAKYGFDLIRYLEPLWLEAKQAADLAVVELLRQEELPIRDGQFGLLDQTKVTERLKTVFPHLPKHAVDAMMMRIMFEYRKHRYDVLVRGDHSTLTHKYGYPILIRKGKWSTCSISDDMPAPRIQIIMGKEEGTLLKGKNSNQRLTLELCGGAGYARYVTAFKKLLTGEAVGGELALKGVKPAGLPRSATELYANLRLELPTPAAQESHGALYVATDDKSFLYARVKDHRLWRFNADQLPKEFKALEWKLKKVPGWIERHDERLQRLADDLKFELRTDSASSEAIAVVRERFVERQHDRINDFIETVSGAVANYARRRRFAQIVYNDQRRKAFGGAHFPWFLLQERLRQKTEAHGLTFSKDEHEESLP